MNPLVSVIVPAYNAERTLGACIASLLRQNGAAERYEIIVVDNGSSDRTRDIALAAGVRVLDCDIPGAASARNTGLAVAQGEIVAFTDADCIAEPNWLTAGTGVLLGNPGVAIVAGEIIGAEPQNWIQSWMNLRRILDPRPALQHRFLPFAQTANAFYRTRDLLASGGFDANLITGEDCDLSWRVLQNTGGEIQLCESAVVEHDHRASVRGLMRQASRNASADAHLSKKWGEAFWQKRWSTSVWELMNISRLMGQALLALPKGTDIRTRFLDLAFGLSRKWGMVQSAVATREFGRW